MPLQRGSSLQACSRSRAQRARVASAVAVCPFWLTVLSSVVVVVALAELRAGAFGLVASRCRALPDRALRRWVEERASVSRLLHLVSFSGRYGRDARPYHVSGIQDGGLMDPSVRARAPRCRAAAA